MATTKTIDITTIDIDGNQTTFKLDNPKNNITKSEIINAFDYGIQNNLLMSNAGALIKSVGTTILTTSEKVEIEGDTVYVTPNELTTKKDWGVTETSILNVTVTGAQPTLAYFEENTNTNLTNVLFETNINQQQVSLTIFTKNNITIPDLVGHLYIYVAGSTIRIPLRAVQS